MLRYVADMTMSNHKPCVFEKIIYLRKHVGKNLKGSQTLIQYSCFGESFQGNNLSICGKLRHIPKSLSRCAQNSNRNKGEDNLLSTI